MVRLVVCEKVKTKATVRSFGGASARNKGADAADEAPRQRAEASKPLHGRFALSPALTPPFLIETLDNENKPPPQQQPHQQQKEDGRITSLILSRCRLAPRRRARWQDGDRVLLGNFVRFVPARGRRRAAATAAAVWGVGRWDDCAKAEGGEQGAVRDGLAEKKKNPAGKGRLLYLSKEPTPIDRRNTTNLNARCSTSNNTTRSHTRGPKNYETTSTSLLFHRCPRRRRRRRRPCPRC